MTALGELRRVRGDGSAEPPRRRDNKAAYLFLTPWLAGLLLITAGPVVASFVLGFTDYNLIQPPTFFGRATPQDAAKSFITELQSEIDAA